LTLNKQKRVQKSIHYWP